MYNISANFYKMPIKVYKLGLSSIELLVLGYLFSLHNNKSAHPSKETIAEYTGLSRRSVDKAIKSLVIKGYLEYDRGYSKGGKNISNKYRIRVEKIDSKCIGEKKEENENYIAECNEMIRESLEKYGG